MLPIYLAYAFGALRIAIGLGPIFTPKLVSWILAVPPSEDTRTALLWARLFGLRDIGLGVLVLAASSDLAMLHKAAWFNAAMDLGDASMCLIAVLRGHQIDAVAKRTALFASGGLIAWVVLALLTAR